MSASSRGLLEHSRSSRHHNETLSFFSQLEKNCCESHVLSDRRVRPPTSKTVQDHHKQDSCCQHKKRWESSLDQPATLLPSKICTKVTGSAHSPPNIWRYPAFDCDSLTSPVSDAIIQKSCVVSSAVAMLRKRLPPLEELRLDEEVATYTSVLAATGFLPPRPRCGNPLAAMLHFEESSVSALQTSAGKTQFTIFMNYKYFSLNPCKNIIKNLRNKRFTILSLRHALHSSRYIVLPLTYAVQ